MTTPTPGDSAAPAASTPAAGETVSITVHPHGELTTYFGRSYGGVPVSIPPGITIEGMLEHLNIPADEVWLVAKNGETVKRDVVLDAGDTVELFAPVAGG